MAGGYSSDAQKTADILDLTTQTISWGGNLNKRRRWFHIATFDYYDQTTTLAVGGDSGNDGDDALNSVKKWNPQCEHGQQWK